MAQAGFNGQGRTKHRYQEGITGEIVLHEDDPEIVDRMIDFLYRQDYDDEGSSLETHAQVYAIADKYEILSLKEWAALKSRRALKRTSKDDADRVAAALEVVWTTTPQQDGGLRSLFLLWVGDNLDKVLDSERYVEVVKGHTDLAMDIIRELSCRQKKGESYCGMCGANRTATDWSCGHFGLVIPPKYFRD